MEVSQILLAAQSGDAATRQAAEAQIEAAKANNLPALMQTMATELANEAAPDPTTRQLAGLVLKNCVQAKSYMAQAALTQRWQQQTAELKGQIKQLVLTSLASPAPQARQTAPQVLAAIAMIELPDDGWPELVPLLVAEFQKGSDPVKQSTLEALGYICEQIDPSVLEAHSNSILTIVVQGMRKEQPNADVRQAGTRALINALSFVKRNFDNDHERNYIMQTVCETTLREQTVDGRQQIERLETRVGAFECLVAIAELYYDKLGAYMTALFELTKGEIERSIGAEGEEEVGQQAVECWVSVCDEELDLIEEEQEAQEEGGAAWWPRSSAVPALREARGADAAAAAAAGAHQEGRRRGGRRRRRVDLGQERGDVPRADGAHRRRRRRAARAAVHAGRRPEPGLARARGRHPRLRIGERP